jgi:hypothetical protein
LSIALTVYAKARIKTLIRQSLNIQGYLKLCYFHAVNPKNFFKRWKPTLKRNSLKYYTHNQKKKKEVLTGAANFFGGVFLIFIIIA